MSTFVTVGNATQPFYRLLGAVAEAIDLFPRPICVQHGVADFAVPNCTAYQFLEMGEFVERVHCSTLLVMHAGAGSLLHAVDAGRIPIVMPREAKFGEHVDDHQIDLAKAMAERGRVVMVRSSAELKNGIPLALRQQSARNPALKQPELVGLVAECLKARERALR